MRNTADELLPERESAPTLPTGIRMVTGAGGRQTVSEEFDVGQEEFVPWHIGAATR